MYENSTVMIFSPAGDTADNICAAASECGFEHISVSDGTDARELITENGYSLVFVNAPLENEFGLEIAVFAAEQGCGVIIAAAAKSCTEIAKRIGNTDIFILPKPMNKPLLMQTFRYVMLSRQRLRDLCGENRKLEVKIKDVKLVDRAKCVLVEYLRISEADAHRQIQKRAMDMRVPLTEIALDILKTYET